MFLTDEIVKDGSHLLFNSLCDRVGCCANWFEKFILLWALCIALECGQFGDAGDDLCVDLLHWLCAIDNEVTLWIHHCDL